MGIKIMAYRIRIKTHPTTKQRIYGVEFKPAEGKPFEKLLKYNDGYIEVSNTARVQKGIYIVGENETIKTLVNHQITLETNALSDAGTFSKRAGIVFAKGMKEYLDCRGETKSFNSMYWRRARFSIDEFGRKTLASIKRREVRAWINKKIAPNYSDITVRHIVGVASAMVNWLVIEERYEGSNPFIKHEWCAAGDGFYIKPTITMDEFQQVLAITDSRQLTQCLMIGYYTGQRPTEIYRVTGKDFDHDELTLKIIPSKRTGKKADMFKNGKLIAIPKVLSDWIKVNGVVPVHGKTIENLLWQRKVKMLEADPAHPTFLGLCMGTFRKNVSDMMTNAGVDFNYIDLHQGRFSKGSVLKQHYLRDPMLAVKLMRPYIKMLFDDGIPPEKIRMKYGAGSIYNKL